MKIDINNRAKAKIDLKLIKKIVLRFVRVYKIKHQEISLAFISDAEIKVINKTYRGFNRPTDILSFPPLNNAEGNLTGQAGEGESFGEIIIDYDQIKRQADRFGNSARAELIFILVHGLLHLLGYDDQTEQDRLEMIRLGEEFIKKFKM